MNNLPTYQGINDFFSSENGCMIWRFKKPLGTEGRNLYITYRKNNYIFS